MVLETNDVEQTKEEIQKILARRKHERFIKHCWQKRASPFLVGIHTKIICEKIDQAIEKYRKGESTFLLITVPFRHGKSDIVSRYLPPHFLGEFPEDEIMLVTYAAGLAEGFNRFARGLVRTKIFNELYPGIAISRENGGVQTWGLEGHLGICQASGLGSGITGKGYNLGILDDYCSSRAEAESSVIREGLWDHFTNDFFTRRAPVSITIVLATPWHVDDIIGRIKKKNNPDSDEYDKDFPFFEKISFPARGGNVEIEIKEKDEKGKIVKRKEIKHYDILFPERFSKEWYDQQFASLGLYASSGLLQCEPQIRGGNLINVSRIQVHTDVKDFPVTKYYRVWDLAHTEKQLMKSDPDWTSGTLLAYRKIGDLYELWIKDVARIRAKAPERDTFIRAVAEKDGYGVTLAVEQSIDSRDALSTMEEIFKGKKTVKGIQTKGDKVARAGPIEPIFEAGNVHILSAAWNLDWLKEIKEFPSGSHDDQVDNITAGFIISNEVTGFQSIKVAGI